ncbi:head maturation protease, ClpP-related [Streptomyces sp. NPDC099050]|uniref:head maturation protease, ClpP-related n=1 Tax=Streptomyces sp. NPDC099050 TaxID=3366100 RepID=UPI003821D914
MDLKASIAERRDWYRITNQAGGPVVVDIFDEIGFWGVNAANFQRELAQVNASEITVNLSSPGGEIFEGIAIYNALRSHPANITVRVSALAASIASVIAQAGDRIVMLSGSQMMIHEGSGLCMGNAQDMQQMAELLDRQSDNIATIYAERAGGTPNEWRERMKAETWFNAEEAVASGLADEVEALPRKGEPAEETVTARWDLSVFNYAGRDQAPAPAINEAEPEAQTGGLVQGIRAVGEGGTDCIVPKSPAAPVMEMTVQGEQGPEVIDLLPHAAELPEPAAEPEPDGWAALTAHLFTPAPDSWAAHVAHLLDNPSSSAATAHA